ncbi:TPA: sirohydrochlorin cobaltochelatase [Candidatus Poribacteria bacterium]|nr:sirohydrochlorin cobaltochelatase [Candidatus Poribacteria bacterium]
MKKAILLLGHGSQAVGANQAMYRVTELIRQQTGYIVEVGFMALNSPSIEDAVANCIVQGAHKIVVIPYFLHLGVHVQRDLPRRLAEIKRQYPDVEIMMGKHLGFHPKLVEVVLDRINESEEQEEKYYAHTTYAAGH